MAHDDHVISIAPPRLALLVTPGPSWSSWSGLQTTPTAPPPSALTGSSTDTCKEAGCCIPSLQQHYGMAPVSNCSNCTRLTILDTLSDCMLSPHFACTRVSIVLCQLVVLCTHNLNTCRPPSTKSGIVKALTEQVRVALHGLLLAAESHVHRLDGG